MPDTDPSSVWLTRGGDFGQDESECLENGVAIIGFTDIPDISSAQDDHGVLAIVNQTHPGAKPARNRNRAAQLTAFALRMREADIVAMPLKTRPGSIALGVVRGPYQYSDVGGISRHNRKVQWRRPEVPRSEFQQDMLYSLGAFMTVCRISRNEAERRFEAVISGKPDPGVGESGSGPVVEETFDQAKQSLNIAEIANNQVRDYIRANFTGHDFSRLIEGLLKAEGYATHLSTPGPDGGVDILAGHGTLGFDHPRICVQVKATAGPADVNVLRALQGTMHSFRADHGLLVSWGGFTRALEREARLGYFNVRLWHADDVLSTLFKNYEQIPEQLRSEVPLARIWTLVLEEN